VRGNYGAGCGRGECRDGNKARFRAHIVAAEQFDAIKRVAGNEALDFVEYDKRIEGAEARLEVVGREPDAVTVGFTGLRAA